MRSLALKFPTLDPSNKSSQTSGDSYAEIFLALSPRVQCRDADFIFIDIESTSGLLGGEPRILEQALKLGQKLSANENESLQAAIADHPYTAQALAMSSPKPSISPAGEDQKTLAQLELNSLINLEGLSTWEHPAKLKHIINFFHSLGIHHINQILHFDLPSFRERWGSLGTNLWKRLHLREQQVISPFIPTEPLEAYGHFDDPVGLTEILMQKIEHNLEFLFLRLEARQRFAARLEVILHCEFSKQQHHFLIAPVKPSRNLNLFLDLLENKLENCDLQNPIWQFELSIYDEPEKTQQLDFFEPRDSSEDRWHRLISFAQQSELTMGFLQPQASHFPEKSYRLVSDWPKDFSPQDVINRIDDSVQVKSVYAKDLSQSPRPSLILQEPLALSKNFVEKLKFFSRIPNERIESAWWEFFKRSPREDHRARDYYFAYSTDGQLLWIYQDLEHQKYFLHGYFD